MNFEEWIVLGPLLAAGLIYGAWRLYLAVKYKDVP